MPPKKKDEKEDSTTSEDDSESSDSGDESSSSSSDDDNKVDKDIEKILAGLDDEDDDDDDMPKTKSNRRTKLKQIVREFADLSSTHGIGHIGEAHSKKVIAIWAFVLFICLIMFGYMFMSTVKKFISFPVSVDVSMVNEERSFPAVTVCNMNPFKKSELLKVDETAGLVQVFDVMLGN